MENIYNLLQIREIFHLEFLRWFAKKIKPEYYALKGGVNLRFFYDSFRYSEDMDLDLHTIELYLLKEKVMNILESTTFQNNISFFGIRDIILPDISKAKQTKTTQRFKVHLITPQGENLFTKIEFSRRSFGDNIKIETISNKILRKYKLAPLLVPHYGLSATITQKLEALSSRKITQGRDIFDLYILSTKFEPADKNKINLSKAKLSQAKKNVFKINFEQFRDVVVTYLSKENQQIYSSTQVWDEIKLHVIDFIEELKT